MKSDIRVFYTVSRKHYGYYVIDGSHIVCRQFWYCGTPRKSAVWATVQNRGACSTLQYAAFLVSFVDNS